MKLPPLLKYTEPNMPYITLLPGIVCIYTVLRWGTQRAFLYVLLPVIFLFPPNFYLEITHLPRLNFLDLTLLPLGLAMLVMDFPRWRFTWIDTLIVLFVFTCGYSEWVHYGFWRTGALAVIEGLFSYMAGKLLLETPGMSLKTVKQIVTLLTLSSIVAMYEFFFKLNPYWYFWIHFYPGQWGESTTQIRWGRGRMSGPFVQSEFAGMILFAGLLLALWLVRWNSGNSGRVQIRRPKLVVTILFLAIFMTQARGPWIGTLIAITVASIGRAKRPLRRTLIILSLGLVIGLPAYEAGKNYLSGPRTNYGSERETAQYRAELIDSYIPLAASGGPWGFGRSIPIVNGQLSIDNEYLFVWLVQGYVGLSLLILLLIYVMSTLIRLAVLSGPGRERQFFFTMIGIFAGIIFTISTVWLGAQTFEIVFLILGWSQAMHPANIDDTPTPALEESLFDVQPLRVYT